MTKTQSDCILNGCFIKPMNENIAVLLPVHSPRWVLGIGIRMHWEKCGEILFFSKILCFLEKSLLSFREKSYFFEKRQDFLMIFPSMQELFSDCFESGNSRTGTGTGFQIPAKRSKEISYGNT